MTPVLHLWYPQNNRDCERDNYKRLKETIRSSYDSAKYGIEQYGSYVSL